MKSQLRFSPFIYLLATILSAAALMLSAVSAPAMLASARGIAGAQAVIESTELITAAVAAMQIGQPIAEEDDIRSKHIGAPTRVRRYLSHFIGALLCRDRRRAGDRRHGRHIQSPA